MNHGFLIIILRLSSSQSSNSQWQKKKHIKFAAISSPWWSTFQTFTGLYTRNSYPLVKSHSSWVATLNVGLLFYKLSSEGYYLITFDSNTFLWFWSTMWKSKKFKNTIFSVGVLFLLKKFLILKFLIELRHITLATANP